MGARNPASCGGDATLGAVPDLVLLRHGQSVWNAENLFTGWVDVDLTELGEAEARDDQWALIDRAWLCGVRGRR